MTDQKAVEDACAALKAGISDFKAHAIPRTRQQYIDDAVARVNAAIAILRAADHGDPTVPDLPPPPPA